MSARAAAGARLTRVFVMLLYVLYTSTYVQMHVCMCISLQLTHSRTHSLSNNTLIPIHHRALRFTPPPPPPPPPPSQIAAFIASAACGGVMLFRCVSLLLPLCYRFYALNTRIVTMTQMEATR